jgi:hypothetical protein
MPLIFCKLKNKIILFKNKIENGGDIFNPNGTYT